MMEQEKAIGIYVSRLSIGAIVFFPLDQFPELMKVDVVAEDGPCPGRQAAPSPKPWPWQSVVLRYY